MSLFRNAALIATSALVLAACQRNEPAADAATDAAAQQTVPAAATVATAPAAVAGPHIASVKVGRYIEPKTFQVAASPPSSSRARSCSRWCSLRTSTRRRAWTSR